MLRLKRKPRWGALLLIPCLISGSAPGLFASLPPACPSTVSIDFNVTALSLPFFSERHPRDSRAPLLAAWLVAAVPLLAAQQPAEAPPEKPALEETVSAKAFPSQLTEDQLSKVLQTLKQKAEHYRQAMLAAHPFSGKPPSAAPATIYTNRKPLAVFDLLRRYRDEMAGLIEMILRTTRDPAALKEWAKRNRVKGLPWDLMREKIETLKPAPEGSPFVLKSWTRPRRLASLLARFA